MTLLNSITANTTPEYSDFLKSQADSISVGDYCLLYGQADIAERNSTYEVQSYLPGWVAIGDDGGGKALLMRLDGSPAVYFCGHGAIGSLDPELVTNSFTDWLAADCPAAWTEDDDAYDDD